jgi:hypothetical protein
MSAWSCCLVWLLHTSLEACDGCRQFDAATEKMWQTGKCPCQQQPHGRRRSKEHLVVRRCRHGRRIDTTTTSAGAQYHYVYGIRASGVWSSPPQQLFPHWAWLTLREATAGRSKPVAGKKEQPVAPASFEETHQSVHIPTHLSWPKFREEVRTYTPSPCHNHHMY